MGIQMVRASGVIDRLIMPTKEPQICVQMQTTRPITQDNYHNGEIRRYTGSSDSAFSKQAFIFHMCIQMFVYILFRSLIVPN